MTIGELKALIKDLPEEAEVYLFDVGIGGTVYNCTAEFRQQKCVEHNGKKWTVKGLIMEID